MGTPSLDLARRTLVADRDATMARMNDLTDQLADLVAAAEGSNVDDEHDPEGATLAFEREQLAAFREQARARIEEIDAALVRVDSGDYGICRQCGAAIMPERLAARHAVSDCVECARRRR